MPTNAFESWLEEVADVALLARQSRDDVWHHHIHTGETVRKVRKADRTQAKVVANGQHGKLGAGGLRGTTASAYTQAICRSAERQALLAMSARSAAAASAVDALELI